MKRIIVLVAMTMVAVMLLSGPVAQVLELPERTAEAKKKKKKKKRQNPTYTTIYCPNRSDGQSCVGTTGRDYLIGTNSFDYIQGREGNDLYDSKGGSDYLFDNSETSNDYYYESVLDFGNLRIEDDGGTNILDLSRRYESDDFDPERDGDDLFLDGPGSNNVRIVDYFDDNAFFYFYFSDGYKTVGANDANTLQAASASEQAKAQEEVVTDSPAGEQISSDNDQGTTILENTDS